MRTSITIFSLVFLLISQTALSKVDFQDYTRKLEYMARTNDSKEFNRLLDVTLEYPTTNLLDVLVEKGESFLSGSSTLNKLEQTKIVFGIARGLREVGGPEQQELVGELNRWVNKDIKNEALEQELLDLSFALKEGGNPNLTSIETKNALTVVRERNGKRREAEVALSRADSLLERMKEEVIDQDEILEGFQALYVKDLIRKNKRTRPEVFYLMGLPGNGKDTIAEAYVNAIWQQEGAHKDHMFRMNIRNKAEAWSYFGSGKGYVGSSELPAFLKFLVEHSGGKYKLAEVKDGNDTKLIVEKNPNWEEDSKILTLGGPERAIVFVNEVHNMPKEVKDNILKQAVERGIFPITNPGDTPNSVSTIELPVTFVFASNEGIELIEPREKNGARIGEPLSYERLVKNYERVKDDKSKLKQSILRTNGEKNDPVSPNAPGTSEEFLSRIPEGRLHLLKPLSPDGIKKIVRIFEEKLTKELRAAKGPLGNFDIKLTDELVDFIVNHNYIASENARPIQSRLESIVMESFYKALINKDIKITGAPLSIGIGIEDNGDNTKNLVFEVEEETEDENKNKKTFSTLIEDTLKFKAAEPLSDEEIEQILSLRSEILDNVFGIEHIVDPLISSALNAESESRNADVKNSATVMMFLGKTSTGKTETAKQFVKARYGDEERPTIIDFNGIRSVEAMNAKILGTFDGRNNPIESEFMKAYDRAEDGKIAFIFDEAANAPKELLKGLYEILRESVVTGFSDGKPRDMKNVSIILTGNAGEEIYDHVPTDIPTDMQEKAMREMFRIFINDEALQKRILNKTFPEALLARVGRNIFHFGPLTDKSKRQLSQLKLRQGLERLMPKESERGWNIVFEGEEDLLRMLHMIEVEGYNYGYQGASIDRFVKEGLINAIKTELLKAKFQNGSEVTLSVSPDVKKEVTQDRARAFRTLTLTSSNSKTVEIDVELESRKESLPENDTYKILTAYHEAGHEIVSYYYFSDRIKPQYLSILPGVAKIGTELVHYAGIRTGKPISSIRTNKESLLMKAAELAGGYTAEKIITVGKRHDAGKSNDVKRASGLIKEGILRLGLSAKWERVAIPDNMSVSDYVSQNLSDDEKKELNDLTKKWLKEAERMAFVAIMSNLEGAFTELSKNISEKGQLNKDQIEDIYERSKSASKAVENSDWETPLETLKGVETILDSGFENAQQEFEKTFTSENFDSESTPERAFDLLSKKSAGRLNQVLGRYKKWSDLSEVEQLYARVMISGLIKDESRDAKLSSDMWLPESVADIDQIVKQDREKETTPVTELDRFETYQTKASDVSEEEYAEEESTLGLTCQSVL